MHTPNTFDVRLSIELDALIMEMENEHPNCMRRTGLRLYKRWLERKVPAWYPEARP